MRKLLVGVGTALILIGAGCAKPETTPAPEAPAAPQANANVSAGGEQPQGGQPSTAPSTQRKTWVNAAGTVLVSASRSYTVTQASSGTSSLIIVKDGGPLVEISLDKSTKAFREWVPATTIMETPSKIGGIDMFVDPATGDIYGVVDAKSGTYVRVHRVTSNRTVGDGIVNYLVFNPSAAQSAGATVIK